MRKATLAFCVAWAFTFFTSVRAGADDSNLAKLCPGAARWEQAHPHERSASAKVTEAALRAELLRREALDQKVRDNDWSTVAGRSATRKVDAENLAWIKRLIAQRGFPYVSEVGGDGVDAAWILVQHAT